MSAGPVTVGEADAAGVAVSSGLLLTVDGVAAVDCEEETPGIVVPAGCVLGVFRPAMTIPTTTTATMRAPMAAQAQPCGPRREADGVVVVCGVPLLFVCWRISGLPFRGNACGPSVGGVVMG